MAIAQQKPSIMERFDGVVARLTASRERISELARSGDKLGLRKALDEQSELQKDHQALTLIESAEKQKQLEAAQAERERVERERVAAIDAEVAALDAANLEAAARVEASMRAIVGDATLIQANLYRKMHLGRTPGMGTPRALQNGGVWNRLAVNLGLDTILDLPHTGGSAYPRGTPTAKVLAL